MIDIEQAARMIVSQYYRDSVQVEEIVLLVRSVERATIERCASHLDGVANSIGDESVTTSWVARIIRDQSAAIRALK